MTFLVVTSKQTEELARKIIAISWYITRESATLIQDYIAILKPNTLYIYRIRIFSMIPYDSFVVGIIAFYSCISYLLSVLTIYKTNSI